MTKMMMNNAFVAIGAGLAAALLFASVISGTLLSIPLFYLAPLPIMITGLGWGHWVALAAALTGASTLGIVFGVVFLFAFLAGAGFPGWFLGYLAMLARATSDNSHQQTLEWYPTGRLVVWAAILAALVVIVAIPNLGTDGESFRAGLHDALVRMLRLPNGASIDTPLALPGGADPERFINFLVAIIPATAAVLATLTNLANLWLAGRVVEFSGRLARPWPQLSAMHFPPLLAIVLAIAIALSFGGGLIGIIARVVSASLLMAYGVLGFAVLHAITQGMNARAFLLTGTYLAVLLIGWVVLALCILGVLDSAIDIRGRVARNRRPPALS
ncbi:MAG TPA: DUF2232 domain-containing protein [Pseudolabrys sp.]|nr:DUF2232 domain-containing protein [Pseudolabrys sp.]